MITLRAGSLLGRLDDQCSDLSSLAGLMELRLELVDMKAALMIHQEIKSSLCRLLSNSKLELSDMEY